MTEKKCKWQRGCKGCGKALQISQQGCSKVADQNPSPTVFWACTKTSPDWLWSSTSGKGFHVTAHLISVCWCWLSIESLLELLKCGMMLKIFTQTDKENMITWAWISLTKFRFSCWSNAVWSPGHILWICTVTGSNPNTTVTWPWTCCPASPVRPHAISYKTHIISNIAIVKIRSVNHPLIALICLFVTQLYYSTFSYMSRGMRFPTMWCVTRKGSDQPAHMRSLIRAFASRLNILWLLSYWLNIIWSL